MLALADAAASLIGRRFGHRGYRLWSADKTFVGSAAFFATTIVLAGLAAHALGRFSGTTPPAVFGIAAFTTLEEALAGGGADNVILPITAAAMLRALI